MSDFRGKTGGLRCNNILFRTSQETTTYLGGFGGYAPWAGALTQIQIAREFFPTFTLVLFHVSLLLTLPLAF
jgi:hypothetical protein